MLQHILAVDALVAVEIERKLVAMASAARGTSEARS